MYSRILGTLIFTLIFTTASGQSLKASQRKAKEAFFRNNFSEALAYAETVLEKDSLSVDELFIGGESARQLRRFGLATKYLGRIPDAKKSGNYAATDFSLGLCYQRVGQYQEAMDALRRFLDSRNGENDLLALQAADVLEACHWAIRQKDDPDRATVEMVDGTASGGMPRFAPLRYADKLYFSAPHQNTPEQERVSRIFTAIQDNPSRLFPENPKNPNLHAAHVSLSPDAKVMYYSLCSDAEYFQHNHCEIWKMTRTYEGGWTAPSKLPEPVNQRRYTSTQPSIGWMKPLNKFALFFASNRPGGRGGLDIWYCPIERDGSFGEAVCLPANTSGDDVTPFFHQLSQTLFFSSDGLPGLGGFDIYQSHLSEAGPWGEIENMGPPLNTSHDDLYYTWHLGSQRGYFASNRANADCPDAPLGGFCTDLFEAEIFASIQVEAFDTLSQAALPNYSIEVVSDSPNEPSITYAGNRPLKLPIGKKYSLVVIAPEYISRPLQVNLLRATMPMEMTEHAYMMPTKVARP